MTNRRVLCAVARTQWHSESTNPAHADNPADLHLRICNVWGFADSGVLVESDRRMFSSPAERTQDVPEHIVAVYGLCEEVVREIVSRMSPQEPMLEWAIERVVKMTKRVFASGQHVHLWCISVDGFKRYLFTSDAVVPDADSHVSQCHSSIGGAVASMYMTILERARSSAVSRCECAYRFAEATVRDRDATDAAFSAALAYNTSMREELAALKKREKYLEGLAADCMRQLTKPVGTGNL